MNEFDTLNIMLDILESYAAATGNTDNSAAESESQQFTIIDYGFSGLEVHPSPFHHESSSDSLITNDNQQPQTAVATGTSNASQIGFFQTTINEPSENDQPMDCSHFERSPV